MKSTGKASTWTLLWLSVWESTGHLARGWRLTLAAFAIVVAWIIFFPTPTELIMRSLDQSSFQLAGLYQLGTRLIFAAWISVAMAVVAHRISGSESPTVAQRVGKSLFLAFILLNFASAGTFLADQVGIQVMIGQTPQERSGPILSILNVGAGVFKGAVLALAGAWLGVKMVERAEGFSAVQSAFACLKANPLVYGLLAIAVPLAEQVFGRAPTEPMALLMGVQFGAFVLVTEAILSGEEVVNESRLADPITSKDWEGGFGRAIETMASIGLFVVLGRVLLDLPETSNALPWAATIEPQSKFSAFRSLATLFREGLYVAIFAVINSMVIVYAVTRESIFKYDFWRSFRLALPACAVIEVVGVVAYWMPMAASLILPLAPTPPTGIWFNPTDPFFYVVWALIYARATAAQVIAVRGSLGAREAFEQSSMVFRRNVLPLTFLTLLGVGAGHFAFQSSVPLMWVLPWLVSAFAVALIATVLPSPVTRKNPSFTKYPRDFDAEMPPFNTPKS